MAKVVFQDIWPRSGKRMYTKNERVFGSDGRIERAPTMDAVLLGQ
jgi:hypothetical protein